MHDPLPLWLLCAVYVAGVALLLSGFAALPLLLVMALRAWGFAGPDWALWVTALWAAIVLVGATLIAYDLVRS